MSMSQDQNPPKDQLVRGLSLTHTIALVIGSVIGTGVFIKSVSMSQTLGSPIWVLLAWVAAGILSLLGALSYAELGSMLPNTGGEYSYLKTAYGDAPAFLYGWMRFVIGTAGSVAAYAVGMSTKFLVQLVDLGQPWIRTSFSMFGSVHPWDFGLPQIVAVLTIWLLSGLNCLGIRFGGRIQTLITSIKVFGILFLIGGVFLFSHGSVSNITTPAAGTSWMGLSSFGAAIFTALWAYDGWNLMPMAAGEVKNPGRNVPWALIIGMLSVLVLYTVANLAYFYALPFAQVKTATPSIAVKVAQTFLGPMGTKVMTLLMVLSSLGALNGCILTSARVPFAMARDGLFFSSMGKLQEKTKVPVWSILIQAMWGSVIAISGSFDQITNAVLFAGFIFYCLTIAAVFVLRKKNPNANRPYRTLLYPVLPLLFILAAVLLTLNTLRTYPLESVFGLGLILLGIPVYIYFKRKQPKQNKDSSATM